MNIMYYDELLKFAHSLLAENTVFRRENAILRQELKHRISSDILFTEVHNDTTKKEAEAQAEKEITWMIAQIGRAHV